MINLAGTFPVRFGVFVALICTAGCYPTSTQEPLAVGYRDELTSWLGKCETSATTPKGVLQFTDGDYFVATKPGQVRIPCEKGTMTFEVRNIDHLAIDGPKEVNESGRALFTVVAIDKNGNALAIGKHADVAWQSSPELRLSAACKGDIIPFCIGSNSTFAHPADGCHERGELVVHFAGQSSVKTLEIRYRTDQQ